MARTRLMFMVLVCGGPSEAIALALSIHGLDARLGEALFARFNWHQSLSDRYPDTSEMQAALLRAGARVRASAFDLTFNRIRSHGVESGRIHWTLHAKGAKPDGLVALLEALRAALSAEGIEDVLGHTAHITLSYRAHEPLAEPVPVAPIVWTVDSFELVEAGGDPYRYRTIERWPLLPAAQAALF